MIKLNKYTRVLVCNWLDECFILCQSTIDYPACRCWTVKHSTPTATNHIESYKGHV